MHNPSTKNLEAGIRYWQQELTGWPADLHNELYRNLHEWKQGGLTPDWWARIVDVLSGWRAIRPRTKAFIYEHGIGCLSALEDEYLRLARLTLNDQPCLSDFYWNEVAGLFELARSIKGVDSPVFASKLCHFLMPNIYPVIDHAVVGVNGSYAEYWALCARLWAECEEKAALVETVKTAIGDSVFDRYPFSTKIVELSLIGERQSTPLP